MERQERDHRSSITEEELRNPKTKTREIRIMFGDAFERACALIQQEKDTKHKLNIDELEDEMSTMLKIRRVGRTPATPIQYRFTFAPSEDKSRLHIGVASGNHPGFQYDFRMARKGRDEDFQEILDIALKRAKGNTEQLQSVPPIQSLAEPDQIEQMIADTTLPPQSSDTKRPQE